MPPRIDDGMTPSQRYRLRHLEKRRLQDRDAKRRARATNPEKFREIDRARYPMRRDAIDEAKFRSRYGGFTKAQKAEMVASQGNKCANPECRRPFGQIHENRPNTDHDHASGLVRSALCHGCNSSLGLMGEDPARMRGLAEYIEGWAIC